MKIINKSSVEIIVNGNNLVKTVVLEPEQKVRYRNVNFRLINIHSEYGSSEIRFKNSRAYIKNYGKLVVKVEKIDNEQVVTVISIWSLPQIHILYW